MSSETSTYVKYKVKDVNLAEWGRKEIHLAESEMPGLMSLREEFKNEQAIKDFPLAIQENAIPIGMQFNLAWGQSRPNTIGLVGEYIKQSLKPTVAYPHVALMALVLVKFYVN